jgi:predicted phage baseplate assembly protein
LNYSTGQIVFGDGKHGKVVPVGDNNVVAKKYKSGGGRKGNLPVCSINMLQSSIPGVDQVTNNVRSYGGNDQEDLAKMLERAPFDVRNMDRAITKQDFESLACYASQDVFRAFCYATRKNDQRLDKIYLLILPQGDEEQPQASPELLDSVKNYLQQRMLLILKENLEVLPVPYVPVDIQVDIKTHAQKIEIHKKIQDKIRQFLHPCLGQEGKGWEFFNKKELSTNKEKIKQSIFHFLITTIPEIQSLKIESIEVAPKTDYFVVCSGNIHVH